MKQSNLCVFEEGGPVWLFQEAFHEGKDIVEFQAYHLTIESLALLVQIQGGKVAFQQLPSVVKAQASELSFVRSAELLRG